jgi:hypothetical protein
MLLPRSIGGIGVVLSYKESKVTSEDFLITGVCYDKVCQRTSFGVGRYPLNGDVGVASHGFDEMALRWNFEDVLGRIEVNRTRKFICHGCLWLKATTGTCWIHN